MPYDSALTVARALRGAGNGAAPEWVAAAGSEARPTGRARCNNAGVSTTTKPITSQEGADWERILRINLIGAMYGMKHQMRQMKSQGTGGAIVNTASTAAMSGSWGPSPYVRSKWALIGLTKTGAVEGAPDWIRVNAICPGPP